MAGKEDGEREMRPEEKKMKKVRWKGIKIQRKAEGKRNKERKNERGGEEE